jgi:hypothetical protein
MKFKIATLFFLSLFISGLAVFAQATDIGVVFSVQKDEKVVKVSIKNNTDIADYKYTATFSDSTGSKKTQSGTFDRVGQQLVVSFTNLEPKSTYSVTIVGTPVISGANSTSITKVYILETNFSKPNVVETFTGTNQTPGTIPDPKPDTTNTNPDPKPDSKGPFSSTAVSNGISSPQTTGLSEAQIKADKKGSGLVPCTDTCDFNDVLRLVNNLISFLITTLFIPIVILLFMYAGYRYITAEGNPNKVVNLKKMVWRIVVGMLIVLCSWLIVNTILTILTKDPNGALQFLK